MIYAAVVIDRHASLGITLFTDRDKCAEYASALAREMCNFDDAYEEDGDCFIYSYEGDCVAVCELDDPQ